MNEPEVLHIIYLIVHDPDGAMSIAGQFVHKNYDIAKVWCRNFVYEGIRDGIAWGMTCVDKNIWDVGGRPTYVITGPCKSNNCIAS